MRGDELDTHQIGMIIFFRIRFFVVNHEESLRMASIIELDPISDDRGNLVVIQDNLPFEIKRVFYIYDVPSDSVRGGHGHKKTEMAFFAASGSCRVSVHSIDQSDPTHFLLDTPEKLLLLRPSDWHTMDKFSENSVLIVLASTQYDPSDYITNIEDIENPHGQ